MAMSTTLSTRILLAFCLLLSLATSAAAQSSSATSSAPASTGTVAASIYPGTSSWTYYGCYGETTSINGTGGARALVGNETTSDTMTVPDCLQHCGKGGFAFAGLEYTRECYCAAYLSVFSAKLDNSSCDLPCEGNSSQICGGSLKLTIYNAKSGTKGAAVAARDARQAVGSVLALAVGMGVLVSWS